MTTDTEKAIEAFHYIKLFCGVHVNNEQDRDALTEKLGDILTALKSQQKPPTQTAVIAAALDAGIAISTAYGQEAGKLCPISDHRTLMAFAKALLTPPQHSDTIGEG